MKTEKHNNKKILTILIVKSVVTMALIIISVLKFSF